MTNTPRPDQNEIELQDAATVRAKAEEYRGRRNADTADADIAKLRVAEDLLAEGKIGDVRGYFRDKIFDGLKPRAVTQALNAVALHNRGGAGEMNVFANLGVVRINPGATGVIAGKLAEYRRRLGDERFDDRDTRAKILAAEAFALTQEGYDWEEMKERVRDTVDVAELLETIRGRGIPLTIAAAAIKVMLQYNQGGRPDRAPASPAVPPPPPAPPAAPAPRPVIPHPNPKARPEVTEKDLGDVAQPGTLMVSVNPQRQDYLRGKLAEYRERATKLAGTGPNDPKRQILIAKIMAVEAFIQWAGGPQAEEIDVGELTNRIVAAGVPRDIAKGAVFNTMLHNSGEG